MNYYAGFGIILLFFGGYYLDQNFHTGNLWAFVGLGLGVTYVAYEIWKSIRKN
ncbi:MAG: ATPase F0F1 [Candidatus Omnitrophica bacterium]|nr:ATPase F0F1 [Candidatus Omnitrophota bacterium]